MLLIQDCAPASGFYYTAGPDTSRPGVGSFLESQPDTRQRRSLSRASRSLNDVGPHFPPLRKCLPVRRRLCQCARNPIGARQLLRLRPAIEWCRFRGVELDTCAWYI
ncbi:hypothetical protein ACKKBG_A29470 [Auxenochlorella protothecoides x Auxenochlorella symbiontica]